MLRTCLLLLLSFVFVAQAQDAKSLRARHAALQDELAASPFGRPLRVESNVSGNAHKGEIYAVISEPYSVVAPALARAAHWCDIIVLQVNIKRCDAAETLSAFITRKARDPVESAYQVVFRFSVVANRADYLHVALFAPSGPVGTRDYEIRLEAAPLEPRRTFIHMSYSYVLGTTARMAMDAYLAGSGRDKVGFSVVERQADGKPVYVDGVRGVVERSSMRYYLAIEAYLESLSAPAPEQLEKRLRKWYAEISRYPQLREVVSAEEYVQMKRSILGAHENKTRPAPKPRPAPQPRPGRRRLWRGEETEACGEKIREEYRAKGRGGSHGRGRQVQHLEAPTEKGGLAGVRRREKGVRTTFPKTARSESTPL